MLQAVRSNLVKFNSSDERIIEAMIKINRRNYVSEKYRNYAYVDEALPLGREQTISQPSTVARMISLLELKEGENVLEIGTGSGWNAALIAHIVNPGRVLSLEIDGELVKRAKAKTSAISNLEIDMSDFRELNEKFGKIIFTAGITNDQENIIKTFAGTHLKEGGILVCPFQTGPILVITKKNGRIFENYTPENYVFVPLVI